MHKDTLIHETAIIDPGAILGTGVEVGPYSVIGKDVQIGDNTWIGPHVVIDKRTIIGKDCKIFQFASVGADPQDLAYKGEETNLVIGNGNIIRESVTIHRGTIKDKGKTIIGNNNLFMNFAHVAHDCTVGNNTVLANAATLAGHVTIGDNAIVGGLTAIHQFTRIGANSIIGGCSAVSKDIPPFLMAAGNRAHVYGLNSIGLRRCGFKKDAIAEIKKAYNIIFKSSLKLSEAKERLRAELSDSPHAMVLLDFIEASKRGITREKTTKANGADGNNDDD
jgi:UDP-N-acetylglucosamine acyltransferase